MNNNARTKARARTRTKARAITRARTRSRTRTRTRTSNKRNKAIWWQVYRKDQKEIGARCHGTARAYMGKGPLSILHVYMCMCIYIYTCLNRRLAKSFSGPIMAFVGPGSTSTYRIFVCFLLMRHSTLHHCAVRTRRSEEVRGWI